MKVIFNKSDLVSALDRVQRAAQTKVTSNTNNGFFISAAGGTFSSRPMITPSVSKLPVLPT